MQFVSDHIVSGNGGKKTEGKKAKHIRQSEGHGMNLHNFFDGLGFSYFRVEKDKIEVNFVDVQGNVVHSFSRVRTEPFQKNLNVG